MAKGGITNFEESPEIVVGLYLIYYIFWHTKNLNSKFVEGGKMYRLYDNVLSMERGRFTRIKYGDDFRYSRAERERLEERFNIKFRDIEIALINGELGATETQWRKYFDAMKKLSELRQQKRDDEKEKQGKEERIKNGGKITDDKEEKLKQGARKPGKDTEEPKVDIKQLKKDIKHLEENIKNFEGEIKKLEADSAIKEGQEKLGGIMQGLEEGEYTPESPVYRIHYYLVHGKRYEAESDLEIAMEALERVKPRDWINRWQKPEERHSVKEYRDRLKEHYEFVNALIYTYETLEKNK